VARYQSANPNQRQRRQRGQNRETMEPAIVLGFIHAWDTPKNKPLRVSPQRLQH
jgi:hypothetical protein